ncbi:MAG: TIGR01440 family protein [Hallerella sp.]|nr:TIGR01440 family protein [Hallerella sp.]
MSGTQTYEVKDENLVEQIQNDATNAAKELVEEANLHKGSIVVVGCSTSETLGEQVGSHSVPEVGKAILKGLQSVFEPLGIYVAAQCCEHLNRAIIVERSAVPYAEIVNVVPQPKAGGSFATACYASFQNPVALEHIKADAGLDIGGTLIGMHLKEVAVPVRLKQKQIGKAILIAARTRPKFIGGERAHYDESLKAGYPLI